MSERHLRYTARANRIAQQLAMAEQTAPEAAGASPAAAQNP
jgi:hypothetical protein